VNLEAVTRPPSDPPVAAETYQQCDECGAPVDSMQRYCVSCGAHRRHVSDPAARFLSQATARSRSSRSTAAAQRPRRKSGRFNGLGIALILALIPAVAAVGVIAGRSSNNADAKLIQALASHQPDSASTSAATPSAANQADALSATAHPGKALRAKHKKTKRRTASTKTGAQASSTTQFGSVSQIAGSKPTTAQEQQGAQATQKVQKSTGKAYVNQQNNLPGTVVVP
jgi:hypothetical protein